MTKLTTKSLFTISLALVLATVGAGFVLSHPARTIAKQKTICGLELTWDGDALFSVGDFLPSHGATAVVTVSNTVAEMRALGIEFKSKGDNPDFLASQINMTLSRSGKPSVTYTLKELYDKGEFELSEFDPADDDIEITFDAEFETTAGNPYQGKKTEFDVVFGCYYDDILGDQTPDEGAVLGATIGLPGTGGDILVLALVGLILFSVGLFLRRYASRRSSA